MMPRIVALVPMKGHSERVPGKNMRPLAGRPLYHWIIDSLLASGVVENIVIDTDSEEIAEDAVAAFRNRVEIVPRPSHLTGDHVPMNRILAHDIGTVDGDIFLQAHSTNPLLRPRTIQRAVDRFLTTNDHDTLFGVTRLYTRLYWPDGTPINHDPSELLRTQDLPPILEENSNIYIFGRAIVENLASRIGKNPLLFEIDGGESLDIDDANDFLLAEVLMSHRSDR